MKITRDRKNLYNSHLICLPRLINMHNFDIKAESAAPNQTEEQKYNKLTNMMSCLLPEVAKPDQHSDRSFWQKHHSGEKDSSKIRNPHHLRIQEKKQKHNLHWLQQGSG